MQPPRTLVALALALSATSLCATRAPADDLTVISFGGAVQKAQKKAYYEPFTKETGIKVIAGEYNGEQAKIKAMVETHNVTWDVVEVESAELYRGCEEGIYQAVGLREDRRQEGLSAESGERLRRRHLRLVDRAGL